jgi:hypothetical protein
VLEWSWQLPAALSGCGLLRLGDDKMTPELALTVLLVIGVFMTVYELEMIRNILKSTRPGQG